MKVKNMGEIDGLTKEEVEVSRREYGSNMITQRHRNSFFKQFISAFGDPIIKILLIALVVNVIFMFRDFNWYETAGIAIAVLLATFISTLSEYGSESAFEKLQQEAANIKCRVKRSGDLIELPIGEIVVGDIILLQAGERIPADGELITGELTVDQSALNGESKEAHKYPTLEKRGENKGFLVKNKLFRGTVVCSGEGIMRAEEVGDNSFYGHIAREIQEETIESPLKTRLGDLAKSLSRLGYMAAIIVIIANLFNNIVLDNNFNPALIASYLTDKSLLIRDIIKALTLGITVIVMAVPEGLPMMITVVLSANMRRMLKDNVLVRKLVGIETSGSLNILFTDKTGTLTKGKLEITSFTDGVGNTKNISQLKSNSEIYELVKLNCLYNNSSGISSATKKKTVIGSNSTDRALLEYIKEDIDKLSLYSKGFIVPFNSKNKYSITEITKNSMELTEKLNYNIDKRHMFLIKGAPEKILHNCSHMYDDNGVKKIYVTSSKLHSQLDILAKDSIRILALGTCDNLEDAKAFRNITLIGFLGIRDEIRKESRAAIKEVKEAGVQVVMVTGDNKETAKSIASKIGLIESIDGNKILTSEELNNLKDSEVKEILPNIRVIARALPSDKSRLVRIAQEKGLVTGMTGDGVNDAPALKKADVGFAMGDGAEIAKEAGDIVILDNNISSIVKAILYGRTIFKSIRKFLIFQLTINLCAVAISVIGPFIGIESPITVIQMLWINIIMDTLAGLAYAGESPLPEYMKEPPKSRNEKIINRYMYNQIVCTGLYTTIISLMFFKAPLMKTMFRGEDKFLLTAFFALFIFASVFNSFNARTYRLNLISYIHKNKTFLLIMAAVSVIQLIIIFYGGPIFRTSGLKLNELLIILLIASSVIIFDLLRKIILRVNNRKGFI